MLTYSLNINHLVFKYQPLVQGAWDMSPVLCVLFLPNSWKRHSCCLASQCYSLHCEGILPGTLLKPYQKPSKLQQCSHAVEAILLALPRCSVFSQTEKHNHRDTENKRELGGIPASLILAASGLYQARPTRYTCPAFPSGKKTKGLEMCRQTLLTQYTPTAA